MYSTVEVRWFVPGEAPEEAEAWFAALGAAVEPEARTDRYLVPASAGEPGIKLRQGRIEVKACTDAPEAERLAPGVEGAAEAFRKWSFPLGPDAEAPQAGWVDVAKRRRVRRFAVAGGAVQPVGEKTPASGCDVELGAVRLGRRTWWTVCLEAYGSGADAQRAALRAVAAHVFTVGTPPLLDAAHATGYVGWLAREAG